MCGDYWTKGIPQGSLTLKFVYKLELLTIPCGLALCYLWCIHIFWEIGECRRNAKTHLRHQAVKQQLPVVQVGLQLQELCKFKPS